MGLILMKLRSLKRQQLLILDDFGIQPLDAQSRSAFMEYHRD